MMNKLGLAAALATLTMAAGMGPASAIDTCAELQAQVSSIKTIRSVATLKAKLEKLRLEDPTCPVIDVIVAQIAAVSTPRHTAALTVTGQGARPAETPDQPSPPPPSPPSPPSPHSPY